MPAYAIVELEVTNPAGMVPYQERVTETVTAHGGKYLVRGGQTEIAEGHIGTYPTKVVLEFPTMDAAKTWYNSPEYQAILPIRLANTKGNFIWIEGA